MQIYWQKIYAHIYVIQHTIILRGEQGASPLHPHRNVLQNICPTLAPFAKLS